MDDISKAIQIATTHARYELKGQWVFESAADEVFKVIVYCRENRVSRLLIDVREIDVGAPSTIQRYWFGSEAAKRAFGAVRVAIVSKPELIDPQKFGTTVAVNRNLTADIFSSYDEALAWLLSDLSDK